MPSRATLLTITVLATSAAFSSPAWAQLIDVDLDDPPTSESDGGRYTGARGSLVIEARNGTPDDKYDHVTGSECFSGGCGRFHVGSGPGKYRGFNLGAYSGGQQQLNLRYLVKFNAPYSRATGFKGDYLNLGGSPFWTQPHAPASKFGGFQLAQSYRGTLWRLHGNGVSASECNSSGYECCQGAAQCSVGPAAAGPFEYADHVNEWVAVELEIRSNGMFRIYLWTRDGRYDGLYMESRNGPTGVPSVTGFSGMYFSDGTHPEGTAVMIDEVVVAEQFVGPPPGFTADDAAPPSPPTDVTVH